MAVPGNVLSGRNRGAHALIRDGAKIVECADDIVEELWGIGRTTRRGKRTKFHFISCFGGSDRGSDGTRSGLRRDGLAALSGLENVRLLSCLIDLELQGRVRRVAGGRFIALLMERASVN
jgi:DNA processing protein